MGSIKEGRKKIFNKEEFFLKSTKITQTVRTREGKRE